MVGQILSRPEYMGHTVNFRSHKESYKDKQAVRHAPEDWLIFENTHKAIVDKGTWELAQSLRQTPRRIDHIGEANPLTGLVYCADCGAKMYNHRSPGKEGTSKPYPSDFLTAPHIHCLGRSGLKRVTDITSQLRLCEH